MIGVVQFDKSNVWLVFTSVDSGFVCNHLAVDGVIILLDPVFRERGANSTENCAMKQELRVVTGDL